MVQKQLMGRWLLREFLDEMPARTSRVLSIGAGLGVAETEIARRGFAVDVLEVEPTSIRFAAANCPDLRPLVGDARSLPLREGRYDLAMVAALDYVFSCDEYIHVLTELRRVIKPDGHVVVVCLSNLSLIGMARAVGSRRTVSAAGEVAWGYQRTIGEHVSAGRRAGLRTESVFHLTAGFDVTALRSGRSWLARIPTWRDTTVGVAFTRS